MEKIRAEEISDIISKQIRDYEKKLDVSEVGTVLSVGDGIARVYGVENAMAMELLEFPGGILGMVLNLETDNVGVRFGDEHETTGRDVLERLFVIDFTPMSGSTIFVGDLEDRGDVGLGGAANVHCVSFGSEKSSASEARM